MTYFQDEKVGVWLGAGLLVLGLALAALLAGEINLRMAGLQFTLAADTSRGVMIAIESVADLQTGATCRPGGCTEFALDWQPAGRS